jgi:RNA polymerase sigma-70 factor (ECF subfamily)
MDSSLETTDAELLMRIQQGDEEALRVLIDRHSRRFYGTAYRILGQAAEAEDVVQESFVKLWVKPEKWDTQKGASFTTWFHMVVVHRCMDELRKRKNYESIDPESCVSQDPDALGQLIRDERHFHLWSLIQELPVRQKTALVLCFCEGVANKEAAEMMKVNIKGLESLLMRAKTTLREWYKKKGL